MQDLTAKLGEMFATYSLEENNYRVHATEYGYFTYLVEGKEFFVETIFISPEYRKTQKSLVLLDEMSRMAKEFGCNVISGTTYMLNPVDFVKFTRKARLLIDAGFYMRKVEEKTIIWFKEVL